MKKLSNVKKPKSKPVKIAHTLVYLSWHHLVRAVIEVIKENREQEALVGWKADDIAWSISDHLRRDLHARVQQAWCRHSHKDLSYFPYNEGFVAKLYFRFRKRSEKGLAAIEKEIATRNN